MASTITQVNYPDTSEIALLNNVLRRDASELMTGGLALALPNCTAAMSSVMDAAVKANHLAHSLPVPVLWITSGTAAVAVALIVADDCLKSRKRDS
jgi:hypothetical protein